MKKKHKIVINNLEIIDFASEGKSIAKHEDMVIFITNAVPGDIADIQLTKKKKSFAEGKAVHFHTLSPLRVEPKCIHFGTCGGCKWQYLSYENQIQFKQKQVLDQLTRIGHLELPEITPILGSKEIFGYRNKMDFTFSNRRWLTDEEIKSDENINRNALGFHLPGRFDRIINIEECHLHQDINNRILNYVREYAFKNELSFFDLDKQVGLLRNLIIRSSNTNELMVIVQFFEPDHIKIEALLNDLKNQFPEITSLQYIINEKRNETFLDQEVVLFDGTDHIYIELGKYKFKISPKSFFQTNTLQAKTLYDVTKNMAQLTGNELVYDLYTGTGSIAIYLSDQAKKVVGIEYVEQAIEDAKINAESNGIENTAFFAGNMKDVLNDAFLKMNGTPDVIVTDPPRNGMDKEVVETILRILPKRIVYVSCNPATQARDLEMLCEKYVITQVQPVDMFPHTHHVENVVCLEVK